MVQHLVELQRNEMINLRNPCIDHRLGIARDSNITFQNLREEFLHQVFAAFPSGGICAQPPFLHNLIEQPMLDRFFRSRGTGCRSFMPCPISLFSFSSFSVLLTASSSSSSNFSLVCRAPLRSFSFVLRSSNSRSGFTCRATWSGSKSSMLLK